MTLGKQFMLILIIIASITGTGLFAGEPGVYFTRTPAISPDGQDVAFSYEGDLWIVPVNGGTAHRLTGMEGNEIFPRFSPDGKWLAFSSSQDGNNNVYVMPIQGGEIRQLTFHDANDTVDSWSWDSEYIYFTSGRYNDFTSFRVNLDGGTPERLFKHYFNTVHAVVEHPVSRMYFFTDSWESYRAASRKRYKGDFNPDIKSYDPKTKELTVHTTYRGKDLWPTIDNKGTVYFASDRHNGEYNLYRLDGDKKTRLTTFDQAIKYPQVSANGKKVVFEKDYQLYVYDTDTGKAAKMNVQLFQNKSLDKEQDFNVAGKITNFDVSPDGKKFAFASRGELFVSDIKGKFIKQLKTAPEGRVTEVKWLKDNKTILFLQTMGGWYNLFKIRADKEEKETQLTFDKVNNRDLELNGDRTRAVYLSGRTDVKVMNLEDFKSKTVVSDELWGFYNDQPYFSPDDRYLVYTAIRNFESDIFLYHFETGKTINLTHSGISESNPIWSPDGKYLFLAADRLNPTYPTGSRNKKIYRIPLEKFPENLRSTEFVKLFKEDEKKKKVDVKNKDKNKNNGNKKNEKPEVTIDMEEIMYRWEQISPNAGSQSAPYIIAKENAYTVFYLSNHDGEKRSLWKTELKPFEKPKTSKIKQAARAGNIVTAKNQYYTLSNGTIGQLNLKSNELKPVKMSYTFRRSLESEFHQMFFEVWATVGENFYDDNLHGVNWKQLKERYAAFLPHLRSRSDLRLLLADLLGELNSSHQGFNSNGAEEKVYNKMNNMQTGLVFDPIESYKVAGIVTDSPVDKKGIDIKTGDILTAVNGVKVNREQNREFYFTAPELEKELNLTFQRAEKVFDVTIPPIPSRDLRRLLYDEWIRDNQRRVDKLAQGRIAYIHMKNMGGRELNKFLIEMTTEWHKRDALILDLRYNTGGNVHNDVLQFLSQRPYTLWRYRGGKYATQPHFAPSVKPIVLLINEQSLSDAEMTAAGFKALKLGTIIGTETYRWLIFTSGKGLVDGSFFRIPSWGCYTLDKENIETNGVKPDIYIRNTVKDRQEGRDPQIERAIREIMKSLEKK